MFQKQLWNMNIVLEELFAKYCREMFPSKQSVFTLIQVGSERLRPPENKQ